MLNLNNLDMREVISLSKALILLNMGGINSPDEVEIFLKKYVYG